jgi:[ribosomal protein S5]-alanine N-acetyltransferase
MIEITSQRLLYRSLKEKDVTENYIDWLNDPDINRYMEIRHEYQTITSCRTYVAKMAASPEQYLFGIFLRASGKHIGNIKLGFINQYHKSAQLSLFIGEKGLWRQGIATETIKTITKWGFDELGLERIEAGCYDENLYSLRAFLKVGYQVEGYFRKSVRIDNRRIGSFWLGILKHEFSVLQS